MNLTELPVISTQIFDESVYINDRIYGIQKKIDGLICFDIALLIILIVSAKSLWK